MFALALVPILLATGLAIDYGAVHANRVKVADAADSAALAAVKEASDYVIANPTAGEKAWTERAISSGTSFFNTNIATMTDVTTEQPKFKMYRTGNSLEATINYKAKAKTYLTEMAGIRSADISGTATATNSLPGYVQINFLIDVSQSMGIGATSHDQEILVEKTSCAIACHYMDIYGSPYTYPEARKSGAKLRIDVVKDAVAKLLGEMEQRRANKQQYQVAIYTFSNSLTQVFAPSTDLEAAKTVLQQIELTSANLQGGSNLHHSIEQFAQLATIGDDGSVPSKRRIFTVLMTDGVENSVQYFPAPAQDPPYVAARFDPNFKLKAPYDQSNSFEYVQGFNPGTCDDVKSKKHSLIALYIEYLIPEIAANSSQPRFDFIDQRLAPHIRENMATCTSNPEFVFSASSPIEIHNATLLILDEIEKEHLRLTN